MKNKYQEAYAVIIESLNMDLYSGETPMEYVDEEYIELIKELIDKETPMKPIWLQNPCTHKVSFTIPICRKCRANLIIDYREQNRCPNIECEQKVDWSEDEED